MINLLIQKGGIDPNTRNNTGATVLMLACKNGDKNTIKTLLKNKANSELKDRYGKTALMYAAINGNVKATELLLNNGTKIMKLIRANGRLFYGLLRKISWK